LRVSVDEVILLGVVCWWIVFHKCVCVTSMWGGGETSFTVVEFLDFVCDNEMRN